jgi:small subunit ribosomal protein S20
MAINSGEFEEAEGVIKQAASELDRAGSKGILHPKNAGRRKSRLMRMLSKAREGN